MTYGNRIYMYIYIFFKQKLLWDSFDYNTCVARKDTLNSKCNKIPDPQNWDPSFFASYRSAVHKIMYIYVHVT